MLLIYNLLHSTKNFRHLTGKTYKDTINNTDSIIHIVMQKIITLKPDYFFKYMLSAQKLIFSSLFPIPSIIFYPIWINSIYETRRYLYYLSCYYLKNFCFNFYTVILPTRLQIFTLFIHLFDKIKCF